MVRAFDDAEVTHVEGDVDPIRDMEIISTELRLKDIEWVEKKLADLKKTGRSLGSSSLADKAKKEEIVRNKHMLHVPLDTVINPSIGHHRESLEDYLRGQEGRTEVRLE